MAQVFWILGRGGTLMVLSVNRMSALAALFSVMLLVSCEKKDDDMVEDSEGEVQVSRSSIFVSREDSIRWISQLRGNPEDTAQAYIMLGVLYLANGYPEISIRYLNLADRYEPGRPITYLNLGDAYNRIGMSMKAAGKQDSMDIMYKKAAEAFKWYVQRVPRSTVTEEIARIVEKYRSMESEKEIPKNLVP
ncbi:tetratricopeptide repeat protein [Gemmatimonadota bacterium]